ncbi:MAG: hypothetical protein HKN70_07940 [Gammaproteobacteria bacterium]|nr:hypothetical protein [Gammaproteobacteria bacterium]
MPIIFKVIVAILTLVAVAFILVPALRDVRRQAQGGLALPLTMVVVVVGGALSMYAQNSDWNWSANGLPEDPAMRALYDKRKAVHDEPHNISAWQQLGTFYLQYGQTAGAVDALGTAFELSRGQDTEINLTLVEALAMSGGPSNMSRASEIINVTLQQAPTDRKALWYGGEIARSLGNAEVARTRWQALLDLTAQEGSPQAESVAQMLRQRIADLTGEAAAAQPAAADARTPAGARPPAVADSSPEAVNVTVDIAEQLHGQIDANTTVFVLARALGQPGPPLAAQRLTVKALPAQITLTDQNAMLPTRKLSGFKEVEVVARVSFGGTPTAKPGDYFGAVQLREGDPRTFNITIDTMQN